MVAVEGLFILLFLQTVFCLNWVLVLLKCYAISKQQRLYKMLVKAHILISENNLGKGESNEIVRSDIVLLKHTLSCVGKVKPMY